MSSLKQLDPTFAGMRGPAPFVRTAGDWLVEKLSRVTTSGEIIREIDGFRFVAIAGVIVFHLVAIYVENTNRFGAEATWQLAQTKSIIVRVLQSGQFGVELFFVISGFVLAIPFARHYLLGARRPRLRSYYFRRVTRIEPPYVICLVVYMAIIVLTQTNWRSYIPNFFASLFYSHNWIYGEPSRIETIFWSLEIEIQFYLLAPLVAMLFSIKPPSLRRGLLIGLIIVFAVFGLYFAGGISPRLERSIFTSLHYFLAGFLLVEIYLAKLMQRPTQSYWWDGVTVLTSVASFVIYDRYWRLFWVLPFAIVLVYVSLFLGRLGNRVITFKPIYIIGGMCYTLYMYHVLVLHKFIRFTLTLSSPRLPFALDLLVQGMLLTSIILILCSLLFFFIEKPFMKSFLRLKRETPGQ